ncbi:MAG: protein translocase subunit SecDF [Ferruginibacter sp.]
MKLKGLVWFFTIALTVISLWELSYTWVVRNYENTVTAKATKIVKAASPELKGDALKTAIEFRKKRILDSTAEQKIYPLFGTTYKQCKANELNLGLDLQGGISVTLDVSLSDLLKSLSNNSKDPALLNAISTANIQKQSSDADFITLFTDSYIKQNGTGKLATIFAGAEKEVKINDNDATVIAKLKEISAGAIKETYKILVRRIDKFGVAQPNINFDENKGIINVELAGVTDIDRVRKLLQASAHLQFWEVYNIEELANSLKLADEGLQNYLNGVSDTAKVVDSAKLLENVNPFFRVINPINPQSDPNTGKVFYPSAIGSIAVQDTAVFNDYLRNEVVKNVIPADCKFLLGVEEKAEKGTQRFFPLYAVKTLPGSDKAPLEGEGVKEARQDFDERGRPAIKMEMTATGSKTWARLTGKNVGRPIAIALDDIVYSAPNVNGAIEGGSSEISGNFTVQEAQDLSNILKSGKLDAPANIVAQQVVGPTLGAESVRGGAMAFGISFLVIFILMLVYYNNGGWVANIALILNLLFTIGVLTAMGFTLTAAGIAGLVLTIGMAVDTNVIIFERIKEELVKGKSYPLAVNDGYKRSLAPVIDAHVTSLLTAVILFYFGLGPVLGFATTQIIGLLLSLFCGILVSRLITEVWTNKQRHFNYFTSLSKKIFKHANYKFIELRKYAYVVSAIVFLAGIISFFNGFHLGVEFKGGRSYTVQFDRTVKNDEIREDLKKALDGDNVTIKTVGDNRHLNITTAYMKGVDNADSAVKARLLQGLTKVLPAGLAQEKFNKDYIQAYSTVQPSISDDLKRGAVKATVFALLAIFLYIFIRFRDWRYSVGTIFTLLHDVFVTLAVFSFFKNIVPFPLEIDQHFIAAVLTVIGFSMNDTVIVFDRIREYSRDMKGATKTTIINRAVNDTLSRTIMTSLTVFLTLLILFIFGGEVTRGFAFAMLIGVVTGTYSSIFVGAPILVDFAKNKPLGAADAVEVKK